MVSKRQSRGATAPARTVARATRLAIVFCVCVVALASAGADADASRVLRRESDSLEETLATVDTTAGPTVATRDSTNASHVFTDETGDMWHVLDGNHTLPNATAAIASTPTSTPSSPPTTGSGHETHSAKVELQETMDHQAASNTTTTASAAAAPAHHKTPMMGFVVIGAMAIVCVGIAAGIAKRKRDRAGAGGDHH